jgi:hypothetical protein
MPSPLLSVDPLRAASKARMPQPLAVGRGVPVPRGAPIVCRSTAGFNLQSRFGKEARPELESTAPSRPRGGGESTSQGRPYSIFKRALQRRNVVGALAAARELPQLSLIDALELTLLVARKDPRRHQRVAACWAAALPPKKIQPF